MNSRRRILTNSTRNMSENIFYFWIRSSFYWKRKENRSKQNVEDYFYRIISFQLLHISHNDNTDIVFVLYEWWDIFYLWYICIFDILHWPIEERISYMLHWKKNDAFNRIILTMSNRKNIYHVIDPQCQPLAFSPHTWQGSERKSWR